MRPSFSIKKKKGCKIPFFILLIPLLLFSKPFIINTTVANGDPLLIFDNENPVYAEVFGKKYRFFHTVKNKKYSNYALIPVSYYQAPGRYSIKVFYKNRSVQTYVNVSDGKYKKEILKVAKKHVSPPKKTLKRIREEYAHAMKIYKTFNEKVLWNHSFSLPLKSKVTSEFGNARVFNGKVKSFHSGIDFRAKKGTPIRAVNDGVVVIAKNRYFAGNSVVLSHGRGIYSCYYHLSRISVKKGERVKKGQIIGYSGKSGRVTGAHLHFSMWLEGYVVNPEKLINLLNMI